MEFWVKSPLGEKQDEGKGHHGNRDEGDVRVAEEAHNDNMEEK